MDIHTSHTTLDYPLYVCDFEPADAGRLIVGGGGGASRTGVGNKITLINNVQPGDPTLTPISEIELSKDEDSVTSLAAGPRRGRTTLLYAGINSNPDSLKKGRNEHLRVLGVDGSVSNLTKAGAAAASTSSKISELVRGQFFQAADPDADAYQRLVRLSAPFSDGQGSTLPQLGACATGLAKSPQIVLFDVTTALPAATAPSAKPATAAAVLPKIRGRLELSKDPADLDVIQTGPETYQMAFCTDYELFLFNVTGAAAAPSGKKRSSSSGSGGTKGSAVAALPGTMTDISAAAFATASEEPYLAYEMTQDEATGRMTRPAFRSIRYITPRFILAVCNLPGRTGAFLLGLRLPNVSPAVDGSGDQARITTQVNLPKSVTQSTGLAVRNLTPPVAPGIRQLTGTQFVVAVAGGGADNSLSLYTLEYKTDGGRTEMLANLHPFRTLKAVHELPMTSIALSHFYAPASASASAAIQYIHLASVSVKNTVVVHSIPLRKLPPTKAAASTAAGAAAAAALTPPRYVVALKSRAPSGKGYLAFVIVAAVMTMLVAQGLLEIIGMSSPVLGVRNAVPIHWLQPLPPRYAAGDRLTLSEEVAAAAAEHMIKNAPQAVVVDGEAAATSKGEPHDDFGAIPALHPVAAFLSTGAAGAQDEASGQQVLFMRGADADHTIELVTHDEAEHGPAVSWENLGEEQRATWQQRLSQAGHWTEAMGEGVLRGVLFGELAGIAGAMVR
ncbi:hypothetical protein SEPCBS119000_000870 [Sporothrix epigloea]|uniref:Guanine nucleotide-exchange factor SEC12 n=1 Tax=Sporothrix epigloea TaxID=1892477 RepID=A0ABP0DAI5_9PEZI